MTGALFLLIDRFWQTALLARARDNSNSFVPYIVTFDGKRIECHVSKWQLHGFVKGDHVKWESHFQKIDRSEINRARFPKNQVIVRSAPAAPSFFYLPRDSGRFFLRAHTQISKI